MADETPKSRWTVKDLEELLAHEDPLHHHAIMMMVKDGTLLGQALDSRPGIHILNDAMIQFSGLIAKLVNLCSEDYDTNAGKIKSTASEISAYNRIFRGWMSTIAKEKEYRDKRDERKERRE